MNNSKAITYYYPNYEKASSLRVFQDLTSQIRGFYFTRSNIKAISQEEFVSHYAVYFLFEDNSEEPKVYIGQSENGIHRIKDHVANKLFWNYCIMFVTDNNQFDKTCIDYLEWHFINLFKGSNYVLINSQERSKEPNIDAVFTKPTILNYAAQIEFLLEANGINLREIGIMPTKELKIYEAGKGINAKLYIYDGMFFLKKGSVIKKPIDSAKEWKDGGAFHRRTSNKYMELIEVGLISEIDENTAKLNEDIMFSSPSFAADMCTGYSENGWTFWKGLKEDRERR